MATTHKHFFARIAADPEDDSAKLIYADWLEEQGDPRSELIRVHAKLSQLPTRDPEFRRLLKRKRQLCKDCETEWLESSGVLSRDTLLDAVGETLWQFRGYEKYGSEEQALKALGKRRGCAGYSDNVIAEEFRKGVAVWSDMEELRQAGPSIHSLREKEFERYLEQMKATLSSRHPAAERAISSATSWVYMNYVR